MKKFLTLTIIAIIALIGLSVSVNAADMTASEFLADLADGKMSADVKLTGQVVVDKDMTFDLDGNTLTMTSDANISVQKGELTVKNGIVVAEGYAFRVEASEGNAVLNIESNVEVTAVNCAVFIKKPGSVLNTEGDLTATGGFATISGNGLIENGGVEVNITGGSVTHASEAAVYFPNTTTLNISGGTITGTTAVYHKSGKLNISGGTLKATGAKAAYVHNNNGCDATGDALVIEASDYPGGVPVVSITGGTFTSKNNKAIGYYKQAEDYKLANEDFITGGTFSSDVNEYIYGDTTWTYDEKGNMVIFVPIYLDKPTNVKWDGTKATWDAVPNADGYGIMLTNGEWNIQQPIWVEAEDTSYDFSKYLTDKNGEYVFIVWAEGNGNPYYYSEDAISEAYVFPVEEDKKEEPKVEADKKDEKDEKDETPKTGSVDTVLFASVIVAVISIAGIVTVKKYTR